MAKWKSQRHYPAIRKDDPTAKYAEARYMTKRMGLGSGTGFTKTYGSMGKTTTKTKLTPKQEQALRTAVYATAAPIAGAGADALGEYLGGDIDSSGEAFGRGALSGAAEGALSGAALGSSIAPGIGTAIGAGIGFIGGGLMKGLSSQKEYEQYKKVKKAQEKAQRYQKTEAQAAARRMSGYDSIGMDYKPETVEGVNAQLGSGMSSFDAYKASRYGG